jgi:hypothetical protein
VPVGRHVNVALVPTGPNIVVLLAIFALCICSLHESNYMEAPFFVAISTVGSVEEWQQHKKGLFFSTHLATVGLEHTPWTSRTRKGLVRLLPACFGLPSPATLPWRCCLVGQPGDFVPGHLRLQPSNVSRWATFLEPRQTLDQFTPRSFPLVAPVQGLLPPSPVRSRCVAACNNDSDVSRMVISEEGSTRCCFWAHGSKHAQQQQCYDVAAVSCCQSNGNRPS